MSAEPAGPQSAPYKDPGTPTASSAEAPRRALVQLMILATAVLFVGLFIVLYFRWAGAEEPSSALIVKTTPAFDGAEIVVEGVALPEPYRVRVGERRGVKEIPFYLDRGSYTLRVRLADREIYNAGFSIDANRLVQVDLARFEHLLPPTTAPSTAGGST